jgi:hypothetical protein
MNSVKKAFGWLCIAIVFGLGITMIAYPAAVTQVAGLAVAQSSTQWNQLKDFAIGDAQSNGAGLFAPCLYNGVTCDRQRGTIAGGAEVAVKSVSGGVTPADAFANPTNALTIFGLNGLFNGTTWDRIRSATADALASTGIQSVSVGLFNGTAFDRKRSASSTNNTATTSLGVEQVAILSTWTVTNTPAVATQATASKATGGGTVRHVATSVTVCVAAAGTAQTPLLFHLRDGATGAGTIIRTWAFSAPINSAECDSISGLNQTGTANTAMTIESAAAPVAAAQATVTLTGYSTP